jgi:HK97 family phage major capsid protein
MLTTWLDGRFTYSVGLKEESVILNGDATATPAIQGLMNVAPAFSYTPTGTDQGMDVIARAAGQLMGAGYPVDGVVLNSVDYVNMRLRKSTTGNYIFMGTASTGPDDETLCLTRVSGNPKNTKSARARTRDGLVCDGEAALRSQPDRRGQRVHDIGGHTKTAPR